MKSGNKLKHPAHLKLKAALVEKEINREEVAKLLGIHKNTLSSKINGQAHFDVSEVNRICQAYDLNLDIFFYEL